MRLGNYKIGMVGISTAFGASLCCTLPLAIVMLGLGSGAFMAYTMQFRVVFYPLGLLGLFAAIYLFWREKRRCDALVCKMRGKGVNLALVILSGALMVIVTYVDFFLVQL